MNTLDNKNTSNLKKLLNIAELQQYKKHLIEDRAGLEFYPYSSNKSRVFAYKTIFMTLAAVFGGFSFYLHNSSLLWTCSFIFGNCINLKLLFTVFSGLLGSASLVTSLIMSPEREVTNGIVSHAKRRAKRILNRKLTKLRHDRLYGIGKEAHDSGYWRHIYDETLEKISDHKEETSLIIKRVQISKKLSETEKERLYNQALHELKLKLAQEIESLA